MFNSFLEEVYSASLENNLRFPVDEVHILNSAGDISYQLTVFGRVKQSESSRKKCMTGNDVLQKVRIIGRS
jgi:hypothetical protein